MHFRRSSNESGAEELIDSRTDAPEGDRTVSQDSRSPFSFSRPGTTSRPAPSLEDLEVQEEDAPAAPIASDRVESVVDASSTFDGHYTAEQDLRIQGTVSGEITCRGLLTIEQNASARARIDARDAEVFGTVDGDITCSGRLRLASTAVLTGTVRTRTLIVEEGASITGSIETNFTGDASSPPARKRPRSVDEKPAETAKASAASATKDEAADTDDDDDASSSGNGTGRSSRPRTRDLPSFALVSSEDATPAARESGT
jgi:cytoskeletal protein CcmA (bactofilin family)